MLTALIRDVLDNPVGKMPSAALTTKRIEAQILQVSSSRSVVSGEMLHRGGGVSEQV